MKKSKITKEEWDKRDLTDILNKYDINVYDFIYYLIEFELPEFNLNYKIKKENCGESIQVSIIPRIAAINNRKGSYDNDDGEGDIYND